MKGNTRNSCNAPVFENEDQITQALKAEQQRLGWTNARLAKRVGCHTSYVNQTLTIHAKPFWSLTKLQQWANALGLEVELRLRRKDAPPLVRGVSRAEALYALPPREDTRREPELEKYPPLAFATAAGKGGE
jgi:transcriptional regulator with XRE-family HTH domain